MSEEPITVHIERLNPDADSEPHWQTFTVPYEQRHSVLTLLNYIYEHQDRTVGYRPYTCGRGICNSCQVKIDGKVRKGCATQVAAGASVRLSANNSNVIRDVATVLRGGPPEPEILAEWRGEAVDETSTD